MIVLDVRSNYADFISQLDKTRLDNLPQAMAWAFNASIDQAKLGIVDEMRRVFDRPTPYTLGGVFATYASKRNLVATVRLKDNRAGDSAAPGAVNKGTAAAVYLKPEIEGGQRNFKRMERALQLSGLMPANMYAVPATECPLDAYGNVPASFIKRMLSDLQAFTMAGSRLNRRDGRRSAKRASNAFFAVTPDRPDPQTRHLKPGIYWRLANKIIIAIFHYTRAPTYSARFDFYGVSERIARAEFPRQFPAAWRRALDTDRNRPLRLAA